MEHVNQIWLIHLERKLYSTLDVPEKKTKVKTCQVLLPHHLKAILNVWPWAKIANHLFTEFGSHVRKAVEPRL